MNCDICGREAKLFKTDVEGSVLNLCEECSKFGKVISVVKEEKREIKVEKAIVSDSSDKTKTIEEDLVLTIVPDYGEIIKKKREELGIKQEDFAKKINEKRALIHKIEINQFEPSIALARKIEKFLHIKLIEMEKVEISRVDKTKGEHFTIGDFVKVKK